MTREEYISIIQNCDEVGPPKEYAKYSLGIHYSRLKKWSRSYHLGDKPTVEDSVYDQVLHFAKWIEEEYPDLTHWNTPTKWVGYPEDDRIYGPK